MNWMKALGLKLKGEQVHYCCECAYQWLAKDKWGENKYLQQRWSICTKYMNRAAEDHARYDMETVCWNLPEDGKAFRKESENKEASYALCNTIRRSKEAGNYCSKYKKRERDD